MADKKLSEELRHCLDSKGCQQCSNYQSESRLTCPKLLKKAYEVVKRYEEMEERNRKMLDELTKDCCCEIRPLTDFKEDRKNGEID